MKPWMRCAVFLLGLLCQKAQAAETLPKILEKAPDISAKPGLPLPLNVLFTDHMGNPVTLRTYFAAGKPVILTLNYYRCASLCTAQLNALVQILQDPELGFHAGTDFQVVTVSIDPKEEPPLARAKRQSYVQQLNKTYPVGNETWPFLTGSQESIATLANTLGFQYRYDKETETYIHSAATFVFTAQGTLSQVLYGPAPFPKTLRLSLVEASHGGIGNPVDKFLVLCYDYDRKTAKYGISPMFIMRMGAALTVIAIGLFLFFLWRGNRRQPLKKQGDLQ